MKNLKTLILARKIVYIFFTVHCSLFAFHSFSQGVAINPTGGAADNSAMLDVSATNQGIRIPRVALTSTTDVTTILNPVNSLLVYDSAATGDVTPGFYYWDGSDSKWVRFSTGSGSGWSTSGNAGTDTATNFIGTTDDRSWVMKTNNSERMKISKTGNIGIGTSNPASSAILDVSSTTKGQLIPRMTAAERDLISSPATGLQIYNTDCNVNEYYTGSCWVSMGKSLRAPGPITGTTVYCTGQSGAYSISSVPGATSYTWSIPAGASINSGQGTTSINVTFGSYSGNICVTASNNCETSLASCIDIAVNSSPATPGNITGSAIVQRGTGSVSYSISAVPGATSYNWTVPSGASITLGAGTAIIMVSFPCGASSGNVSVTAQNSCGGVSASSSLAITAGPVANAGPNIFGQGYIGGTLGVPTASGGQTPYIYSWSPMSTLSDPSVANPLAIPTSTTTYTVVVTDANNCTATSSAVVTIGTNAVTFNNTSTGATGTIQTWSVPAGVTYIRIEAYGAEGGASSGGCNYSGGKGAVMRGNFSVTQGNLLQILVGQAGTVGAYPASGGGGGGTFVALGSDYSTAGLLVAAGGGGGSGGAGSTGTSGGTSGGYGGGANGSGGTGTTTGGAGGGGFLTNGTGNGSTEGRAFRNGGAGGTGAASGGFGGGGATLGNSGTAGGGSGGGGYSGGGGNASCCCPTAGGGGGSYSSGANQYNTAGFQTGHGKVVINY